MDPPTCFPPTGSTLKSFNLKPYVHYQSIIIRIKPYHMSNYENFHHPGGNPENNRKGKTLHYQLKLFSHQNYNHSHSRKITLQVKTDLFLHTSITTNQ